MIEQMVTKHKQMQKRHADVSTYRQSTMTQEFEAAVRPKDVQKDRELPLPPNWTKCWDNAAAPPCPYWFNIKENDIAYEVEDVFKMEAWRVRELPEFTEDDYNDTVPYPLPDYPLPDGVLSSNKNTISPSPVNDRARKPVQNGGFVDMTGDSSDDDYDDSPPIGMATRASLKTPPPSLKTPSPKKQKRMPFGSPKTANPWATRVRQIKKERPSWLDDVDAILGSAEDYVREVHTEDLPSTQDFGGAKALVALQSDPKDFAESSDSDSEN
jgi:hypothetical protein